MGLAAAGRDPIERDRNRAGILRSREIRQRNDRRQIVGGKHSDVKHFRDDLIVVRRAQVLIETGIHNRHRDIGLTKRIRVVGDQQLRRLLSRKINHRRVRDDIGIVAGRQDHDLLGLAVEPAGQVRDGRCCQSIAEAEQRQRTVVHSQTRHDDPGIFPDEFNNHGQARQRTTTGLYVGESHRSQIRQRIVNAQRPGNGFGDGRFGLEPSDVGRIHIDDGLIAVLDRGGNDHHACRRDVVRTHGELSNIRVCRTRECDDPRGERNRRHVDGGTVRQGLQFRLDIVPRVDSRWISGVKTDRLGSPVDTKRVAINEGEAASCRKPLQSDLLTLVVLQAGAGRCKTLIAVDRDVIHIRVGVLPDEFENERGSGKQAAGDFHIALVDVGQRLQRQLDLSRIRSEVDRCRGGTIKREQILSAARKLLPAHRQRLLLVAGDIADVSRQIVEVQLAELIDEFNGHCRVHADRPTGDLDIPLTDDR